MVDIARKGISSQTVDQSEMHSLYMGILKTTFSPLSEVIHPLQASVLELAGELGKRSPKIRLNGPDILLDRSSFQTLSNGLTHLVRNSVDHGFSLSHSSPEIVLEVGRQAEGIQFTYFDNGSGLNLKALREKGAKLGWIQKTASADEVASLIFKSGFSSKETVSQVSGRGVGMDAFQAGIIELGGKVQLKLLGQEDEAGRCKMKIHFTISSEHVIQPVLLRLQAAA